MDVELLGKVFWALLLDRGGWGGSSRCTAQLNVVLFLLGGGLHLLPAQTLAGSRTTPRVISLLLPGPGSWPPSNWFPLGVWEEHSGAGKERTRTRETPGAGGAWLERSAGKAELGSPGGSELARAPKATERASSPGRREGREWGGEMGPAVKAPGFQSRVTRV